MSSKIGLKGFNLLHTTHYALDFFMINKIGYYLLILTAYIVLSLIFTCPLGLHISTHLPSVVDPKISGQGDIWNYLWMFWQFKKSLLMGKGIPFYTTDVFYPQGIELPTAYVLTYYSMIYMPLKEMFNPVAAWNLLILSAFVFSGFGMYLLCYYLTGSRIASFIGGIIFAFSPYHLARADAAHITLLSSQWVPLYTLFLLRTIRESSWKNPLLAAAFLFLSCISSIYYTVMLFMITGFLLTYYLIYQRNLLFSVVFIKRLLLVIFCVFLTLLVFVFPLFTLRHSFGYVYTPLNDPHRMGVDLLSFFLPSVFHPIFGKYVVLFNKYFPRNFEEGVVYVGYCALVLSFFAIWHRTKDRDIRLWAFLALIFFLLTMGSYFSIGGISEFHLGGYHFKIPLPYFLMQYIPIIKGIRAPIRFDLFLMLSIAILSSFGFRFLIQMLRINRFQKVVLITSVISIILLEYNTLPLRTKKIEIPTIYNMLAEEKGDFSILELPCYGDNQQIFQYYQTIHGKKLLFGHTARIPRHLLFKKQEDRIIRSLTYPNLIDKPEEILRYSYLFDSLIHFNHIYYVLIHKKYLSQRDYEKINRIVQEGMSERKFYEDEDVVVYKTREVNENRILKYKSRGWSWLEENIVAKIDFGKNDESIKMEGYSFVELMGGNKTNFTFRWSVGDSSIVYVPIEYPDYYILYLNLRPFTYKGAPQQTLKVYINGKFNSEIYIHPPGKRVFDDYAVETDSRLWKKGINKIEFRYGYTAKPVDVIDSKDHRPLSVAFTWMHIKHRYLDYNWSDGKESELIVKFPDQQKDYTMFLGLVPFDFWDGEKQKIKVYMNDKFLREIELSNGFSEYQVRIPNTYIIQGNNKIRFSYARLNNRRYINRVAFYYIKFDNDGEMVDNVYRLNPSNDEFIHFISGWSPLRDIDRKSISWQTKNRGIIVIQNPGKDALLKFKGYTRLKNNRDRQNIHLYIADVRVDTFDYNEFNKCYFLPQSIFNGARSILATFVLEHPVDASGLQGLFIEEINVISDSDEIVLGNGWYREEKGRVSRKWRWIGKGAQSYLKKHKDDVMLRVEGKTNIEYFNRPLKVVISLADKVIDEFILTKYISNFSKAYILDDDLSNGDWHELIIETDQTFIPDEVLHNGDKRELALMITNINLGDVNKNRKDLMIEEAKNVKQEKIIFGIGWYPEEKSEDGKKYRRWMWERAVCYIKNLKRNMVVNIEGTTSVRFFKKPIKVIIYLSDKKIDEFILPTKVFSKVKSKLTGRLFSKTYNINNSHEDGEWHELIIETDQTFIPDEVLHNGDKRELALMITNISVK
ncbi:MAG: hypothetical protein ACE5KZ_02360 [Candidatus Scalinduaceae bacterium]